MSLALKALAIGLALLLAFEGGHSSGKSSGDLAGFTRGVKEGTDTERAANVSRETALAKQREEQIHAGIEKGIADEKVKNTTLEHQRDVALSSADYWYGRLGDWVREHPGHPNGPGDAVLPARGPSAPGPAAAPLAPDPARQRGDLAGNLSRCGKSLISSTETLTELFDESDYFRARLGLEINTP